MAQDTAKVCEDERQATVGFIVISNLFAETVIITAHRLCSHCPWSSSLKIMTDREENNPVPEEHNPSYNATVNKNR